MRIPKTRRALAPSPRKGILFTCVVAAVAALAPAPAAAQEVALDTAPFCQVLLESTPPVFVDLDGDGNPDVRPTRIHDVTLCGNTWGWAVVYQPRVEFCSVSWNCVAVRIRLMPVEGQAGAGAEVCYSADGARTCHGLTTPYVEWPPYVTVCIGVDFGGGHPCDGSVFAVE